MMMKIQQIVTKTDSPTVGQMVAQDYRTATVFKRFGIDFCCGGKKTLQDVCSEKGIELNKLTAALDSLQDETNSNELDFNSLELDELIDHIINTHHAYVIESLPILEEFSTKVARVHGQANPEVVEIANQYRQVADELQSHMHKEEMILFPYIKHLLFAHRSGTSVMPPPFGTINNPIRMMEAEHDFAGNALKNIRELSSDFTPPEHACNTYRVLYAKLREFEEDLHRHVHLENNVLFPRATELETRLLN